LFRKGELDNFVAREDSSANGLKGEGGLRCKRSIWFLAIAVLAMVVGGCGSSDSDTPVGEMRLVYQFVEGAEGWIGDFADYPRGREEDYELRFAYTRLPSPLDTTKGALMLSGNNHSDDLFMFLKRRITGLTPNTVYSVAFRVEIASNVADGMTGIGGSPGEGVVVKVGAVPVEPLKVLDPVDGYYRMNIDKGNQSVGGRDMIVIGDFSNDTDKNVYALKQVATTTPFRVQSDDGGNVWVIVGTDSGFEGTTTIYYNEIEIVFTPAT